MDAVPGFVQNVTPPTVSFKYTKTIAGRIFNQKKVVKDLDVNVGNSNIYVVTLIQPSIVMILLGM